MLFQGQLLEKHIDRILLNFIRQVYMDFENRRNKCVDILKAYHVIICGFNFYCIFLVF